MLIKFLYAISCAFLWAGTTIAGKVLAKTVPTTLCATLRYVLAVLFLLPFINWAEYRLITRQSFIYFLLLGITSVFLFNMLFFGALAYTSPITVSLILAIHPLLTLLFSSLITKQIPAPHQYGAFMLSFTGASMVITNGTFDTGMLSANIGEFLMLGAVLSQVCYTLLLKKMSSEFSPLFLTFVTGVTGLIFLAPLCMNASCITMLMNLNFYEWMLFLYVGCVGTALGFIMYVQAIKNLGPAQASLLVFSLMPVFVLLFAFLILGDHISWWQMGGGLCVLAALYWGLKQEKLS